MSMVWKVSARQHRILPREMPRLLDNTHTVAPTKELPAEGEALRTMLLGLVLFQRA